MKTQWVQICAFNYEGQGIDAVTETSINYENVKDAVKAANKILNQYSEINAVWVRRINDGHMRTAKWVTRDIKETI